MKLTFLYDSRFVQPQMLAEFKDWSLTETAPDRCDILIRWGNLNGSDETAGIVLNRKQPLRNCLNKEKVFHILKINKLRRPRLAVPKPDSRYPLIAKYSDPVTGLESEALVTDFGEALQSRADFFIERLDIIKKYTIYLFDMNVCFVAKKTPVKTNTRAAGSVPAWEYEEIPADLDRDTRKVCHLAQRALHVLGLDFAAVHAGIDARGYSVVLNISPTPIISGRILQIFYEQAVRFADKILAEQAHAADLAGTAQRSAAESGNELIKAVLLGADPEFVLRDIKTDRMVYPSEYLSKEGYLGYDERSEQREGRLYPLAEIRPTPDYCPVKLTEKIRNIMLKATSLLPSNVEWLAGSVQFNRYQLGGHIHFSNLNINCRLLRALDNYLGIISMLIENQETSALRRKQYGWLGSIRQKPHGGFEYRVPGSWLVSPEITAALLCLAKIVSTEYSSLNKDFFVDLELQKAFYLGKKYRFYDIFNELWEDICGTNLFNLYSRFLMPIADLISSGSQWNEEIDMRKTWGLLPSGLT